MERLAFAFYRALYVELRTYETHLSQLKRDYERELRGERLYFAVDFSELYNYMHFASKDADRAALNIYILDSLEDQLSLLPGAVGELLTDLENSIPGHFKPQFTRALLAYPAVSKFVKDFAVTVQDEERLVELYAEAEGELRSALGEILDILIFGASHSAVQALQKLLQEGKLKPIDGVQQIQVVPPQSKVLLRHVESHLTLSRPGMTESNQVDAVDFAVALLLNQLASTHDRRYITIYSQARSLILACSSHDELRWDDDYLVREAKYLQYRTRLQELHPTVSQRHLKVVELCELCTELMRELSALVDIDEQLEQAPVEPPLRLLNLYRRFDEEVRQPLSFEPDAKRKTATRENAEKLYSILVDEARFEGEVGNAYDVLKEHLRSIERRLQAFTPMSTDTQNSRAYKASLRRWLELEGAETSLGENREQTKEG
jgi:hypothetical protein